MMSTCLNCNRKYVFFNTCNATTKVIYVVLDIYMQYIKSAF